MLRFLARRTLQGLLVIWLVTVIVFLIFYVGPGSADVARALAGRTASPETVALISHRLLLDRPWYEQYWHFLTQLLHGNLGYDYYHDQSVAEIIKQAFPITFSLLLGAAPLWLVLGVGSGVFAAVRPRSLLDRVATAVALFFYSMPTFVLGLLLVLILYYELTLHGHAWFPPSGYTPFTEDPLQWARSLILPWVTLALVTAGAYTRLSRTSMLEVMNEDFLRTARAKGLKERKVVYRHGLRAASTPIVTQFGIDVGALIGGAVITEQVFGLPGLGYTAVHAIEQQDLPVIIGIVLVASAGVVVANILVDLFYAVLDPRVRVN
jgi:peptide/nickel transport system permease protein